MKIKMMKGIVALCILTVILSMLSCSKKSVQVYENFSYNRPTLPIVVDCEESKYTGCEHVVWCFHNHVGNFAPLQMHSSFGNHKVLTILNCLVEVNNNKGELQELANSTLIQYYSAALVRGEKSEPPMHLGGGIHSYNPFYKSFAEWNSKESFELGLKFLEYKAIHCWDTNTCDNLRWNFITYVLLPKLDMPSTKRTVRYRWELESEGIYEDVNNMDNLEKFVEAFIELMIQDWNDGKLKLKVEEEQESER
jgi:hypothetical protein